MKKYHTLQLLLFSLLLLLVMPVGLQRIEANLLRGLSLAQCAEAPNSKSFSIFADIVAGSEDSVYRLTHSARLESSYLNPFDYWQMARIMVNAKSYEEGLDYYRVVVAQLPLEGQLSAIARQLGSELTSVGHMALKDGDKKSARESWELALQITPGSLGASYGLWLLGDRSSPASAEALEQQLLRYRFNPYYDSSLIIEQAVEYLAAYGIWSDTDANLVKASLEWFPAQSIYDTRLPACIRRSASWSGEPLVLMRSFRSNEEILKGIGYLAPYCANGKLSIIGKNLIADGGFEYSVNRPVGWSWFTHERTVFHSGRYGDGFYLAGVDQKGPYEGNYAGKIIGFWIETSALIAPANAAILQGPVSVIPGNVYYFSYVYKTQDFDPDTKLNTVFANKSVKLLPTQGEWFRVSGIARFPVFMTNTNIYIPLYLTGKGQVWLDGVELYQLSSSPCFLHLYEPAIIVDAADG